MQQAFNDRFEKVINEQPLPGITSEYWQALDEILETIPEPDFDASPSSWTRMQKVGLVASYVRNLIWSDIRDSINNGAYLAGLSLALALIDYLGGFLLGLHANHETRYKSFINKYIEMHSDKYGKGRASNIYRDLRGAFFHNLVLTTPIDERSGRRYVLMGHPNISVATKNEWENFSLTTFAQYVIDAAAKYLTDVTQTSDSNSLAINFEQRFDVKKGTAAIIFKREYKSYGPRYSSDYENPFFPKLR